MKPTIIVSGLARCGTSLTMQMLHACGLRCAGIPPAFEPPESNCLHGPISADWVARHEAVKVIDPHRSKFPRVNGLVLWMDRDAKQQAKSQLKMVRLLSGLRTPPNARDAIADSLKRDRPRALNQFVGLPILYLDFSMLIDFPLDTAGKIADFVMPSYRLDPHIMAHCVLPRYNGSACEPGLDIETRLCEVPNA